MGNCLTFKSPSSIQGVRHNRVCAAPLMLGITQSEQMILLSSDLKRFTFNELKTATQNFHPDNLMEDGLLGLIFKGWITVTNGARMEVIVRSIKYGHSECMAEIKYLGKLHHPNLARLIGYCGEDVNRFLVYEFMANGSFARHLCGNVQPLSWNLRMKVVLGAARGLAFLHNETAVIHRDFKSYNVLLDSDYNAKIFDFDLAIDDDYIMHHGQRLMGTPGYVDYTCLSTGRVTSMYDIYSFGVVLLEMLSGRLAFDRNRPRNELFLVGCPEHFLKDKNEIFTMLDPRLQWDESSLNGARKVALLAYQCTKEPKYRPSTTELVEALESLQA